MPSTRANVTATVGGNSFFAGKNRIINGDFGINQRAWSSSTGNSFGYTFDRWTHANTGGTFTLSAQTFTVGTAPVTGYEAKNFLRSDLTGQTLASHRTVIQQPIESVRTFANQTITISFWAKAGSGTPKVAVSFVQSFGSGGSPSGGVETYAGQATLSTSWARYSVTVAVPSISGKTLGTTDDGGLYIRLWTSAGSDYNSVTGSLGLQNAVIDFWGVQVEAGSVATAFQTATGTIPGELAACKRYFNRFVDNSNTNTGHVAMGRTDGNNAESQYVIRFDVEMRSAPTFTVSAAGDFKVGAQGSSAATALTANNINTKSLVLVVTTGALQTYNPTALYGNATTNGRMDASAEL
jgi:hypothetical protein